MGRPLSLDAVMSTERGRSSDGDMIGDVDPNFESAEMRLDVSAACSTLDDRERLVVRLRFYEDMTQRAIGDTIGKSQMFVCRVEKRALEKLRSAGLFTVAG